MFFVRPVRRKRNLIHDKFYQNMSKIFFIYKIEHHNLWNKYENGNLMDLTLMDQSIIFIQIYPNFIHKISKNKAYTGNEYPLSVQNGNLQLKSVIL